MQDNEIKLIVSGLSKLANARSCDSDIFSEEILKEHRTIQQSIFRMFLKTIDKWAKLPETHYDLRNEYTVLTSRKIMKELDGIDGVPYI